MGVFKILDDWVAHIVSLVLQIASIAHRDWRTYSVSALQHCRNPRFHLDIAETERGRLRKQSNDVVSRRQNAHNARAGTCATGHLAESTKLLEVVSEALVYDLIREPGDFEPCASCGRGEIDAGPRDRKAFRGRVTRDQGSKGGVDVGVVAHGYSAFALSVAAVTICCQLEPAERQNP